MKAINIQIHVNIKKMSPHYVKAIKEYQKRLKRFAKIKIVNKRSNKAVSKEKKNAFTIKISKKGKLISSEELAEKLDTLAIQGKSDIIFFIKDNIFCKNEHLAVSKMDFSDELTLTILLEQIYRAFTIKHKMPYHK